MIGIYKITSPTNRIYIGQSMNIKRRFIQYQSINSSKSMPKIYNSLLKYGPENHKFEVIEECLFEELNERERYWQEYYNVTSKQGLNCMLVNSLEQKQMVSLETRNKISKNNARYWLGKKLSEETIAKGKKNRIYTEEYRAKIGNKSKGRVHTIESRQKIAKARLGVKHTEEAKLKMSIIRKGKKLSEETKQKLSKSAQGRVLSQYSRNKVSENSKSKEVLGKKVYMYCFLLLYNLYKVSYILDIPSCRNCVQDDQE
jgi:group I intron endonuclease